MMLVEDWKKAWSWFSVQLAALIATAHEIYEQVEAAKEYIPPSIFNHIMAALTVLVIVARLKKQES